MREMQVHFVHCTISDELRFSTIERTLPRRAPRRRRTGPSDPSPSRVGRHGGHPWRNAHREVCPPP